jgi:hypothetical protein
MFVERIMHEKQTGPGTVIRYNWIEGGNRQLDNAC